MDEKKCEIGIVGLGVMGRNLLLNTAEHGFPAAGYDKDPGRIHALQEAAGGLDIRGAAHPAELAALLKIPRVVMMLVPAGPTVDAVIRDLLPHMARGDVIVDCGNSHFEDTDLRLKTLAGRGIHFLGIGISGGEHGARHGPSIMPGGPRDAYERVKPVLEAVAARVGSEPCVAYLGPGSAGHFVKMVHNGIEYGLMQLISETFDLMKRGAGLTDDELAAVYERWNGGILEAYLLEITARIFRYVDEKTGKRLIGDILDEASQKGTGKWTSRSAMDLRVPVPVVDAAVSSRDLSNVKAEREAASLFIQGPGTLFGGRRAVFIDRLERALYAASVITYAQGLALLKAASSAYGYGLALGEVARIWRGGCIIRAAVLEEIRSALRNDPDLPNLLVDRRLGPEVARRQEDLRVVVCNAARLGIPVPAFMAALAYFDGYRSGWLPASLIQAQRDYFGAHTYERVDAKGVFHTKWEMD
ncbi:MAG TPA: NADP-dependent phosphogluconate dehydrogenase [Syntrophales bacterium]|nr:NADP-dependent phosphogluconate dehydrogenase [Syntrophales bacterium]HOX93316.1 NADP-dependent phosphogluconate dehydrogenase [Syntrophales bacterium]HPI56517.1 NADP-dependent phosphogluconate dehydrogenase [Syntrophales bacterium]HPN25062.1 NADP-dependent phosphogluconate dehydrogenase [Syntrophales bacterium]HQM29195.1 NADP-dependent phosphogluconate dehydrogenase [Syntrophales bacterium]